MTQVNIHEAKTHFSKLIKQVLNGEEVIIARSNKPVAKLVSIDSSRPQRELGTAKGKIQISPDFDEPLSDFEKYMQ
ncbi:type II toxin-antitoxin system Phd/YefM family antitoxin [candidate division KSB1 bacterium]|nr:type II toxin-antitoxin system Phd/YefM family antitoxin [candidate division KSB1 bacterium]NIR69204.1 type II toxin-antitoxin system Phd/YefM family antitoxin [candidate division KSB1 bacterium]NIS27381.1 type II toxin-antitoxin system Phd/YefM family antitoxin [candidate division KSB1 bacterium]NIT74206.1 type II toxin-antitoxin system Phd/YefM family antitoxin [candidate division KSB1 bacterium]NIU28098.1 type II toxin-antitoxin system Phd/YefM family antitoxin [candidate division KSB1 ba